MTEPVNNTRFQYRLPLLLAISLAVGMVIGQQLPHYDRALSLSGRVAVKGDILDEILGYVEAKYVDTVKIEPLRTKAIEYLLEQLDPHSVYITPDELRAVEDDMNGAFEGLGIEFILLDDTIQVISPLSGGPAETAGILAGDKIISLNDTIIAGVSLETGKIYQKMRGPKGSKVKLGILRYAEKDLLQIEVTRDVIPVKSLETAYMLDATTGYVKIARFNSNTYQEFMKSLTALAEENGLKNLILDLRGNPGGYLEEATEMLSQMFPAGKLLVYTQGRSGQRKDYESNGRARFDVQNVAVLIDEGSASASEIVAGAVQDWDRGWVVGRRSFGKGLVQEQYPLSNGGAMRLTIARYYTPSGRSIQRDYKNGKEYDHEAERRLKSGELADAAKIKPGDSTQLFYTGQGRVVFGGGGITPDVFIPLDTSFSSAYFSAIRAKVPGFMARWKEKNQGIKQPATLPEFVQQYNISDELLAEFIAYTEKNGVKTNPTDWANCRAEIKLQLKARMAKLRFGDDGYYQVINDDDPAVEKALQLVKSGQPVAKR